MKLKNVILIFDFDSAFVKVEGLEVLADVAFANCSDKAELLKKMSDITSMGMNGELDFTRSLEKRLSLMSADRNHVKTVSEILKNQVSESLKQNKEFILKNTESIYILSGGFKDFMLPVLLDYGIKEENVYANTFLYNEKGEVIGFDKGNCLSWQGGKAKQLERLMLKGKICAVGDGWTDYEMKLNGFADFFVAFTENIKRDKVVSVADASADNLDKVIAFLRECD